MDAPLSRFASSPLGDATSGLAKPVPRCHWLGLRQLHGPQYMGVGHGFV
jgi:hypothetical protein